MCVPTPPSRRRQSPGSRPERHCDAEAEAPSWVSRFNARPYLAPASATACRAARSPRCDGRVHRCDPATGELIPSSVPSEDSASPTGNGGCGPLPPTREPPRVGRVRRHEPSNETFPRRWPWPSSTSCMGHLPRTRIGSASRCGSNSTATGLPAGAVPRHLLRPRRPDSGPRRPDLASRGRLPLTVM
jgi:hypothetical protein